MRAVVYRSSLLFGLVLAFSTCSAWTCRPSLKSSPSFVDSTFLSHCNAKLQQRRRVEPLRMTATSGSRRRTTKIPNSPSVLVPSPAAPRRRSVAAEEDTEDQKLYLLTLLTKDDKVNRELAERIYRWEQDQRQRKQLPPLGFSVRASLRWVHEAVLSELDASSSSNSSSNQKKKVNDDADSLYSDLVQEGLSALLQAMSTYDSNKGSSSNGKSDWEAYARSHIQTAIQASSVHEEDERRSPRRASLPPILQRVMQEANEARRELEEEKKRQRQQQQGNGNPDSPVVVTLAMVADRLDMPADQLKDYLQWWYQNHRRQRQRSDQQRRRTNMLSVDRTMEISHPHLEDSGPIFVDVEDWERMQNYDILLQEVSQTYANPSQNSPQGRQQQLVWNDEDPLVIRSYLDESVATEGDDQQWIQQHQEIAGRLQDVIPDTEAMVAEDERDQVASSASVTMDNNDDILADMIRENLGSFLQTHLTDSELTVVQMTFGLEGRQPASFRQMASELNLEDKTQAAQLLEQALDKLRAAFRQRYLEPQEETDELFGTADSV
jgi:DNA-directed RNA polymerase sigma subunit (sigma70/sigma32)